MLELAGGEAGFDWVELRSANRRLGWLRGWHEDVERTEVSGEPYVQTITVPYVLAENFGIFLLSIQEIVW